MSVRFDDAWREAVGLSTDVSDAGVDVVLVRDLLGRVSLVVGDGSRPENDGAIEDWGRQLVQRCEPFVASPPVVDASELFQPGLVVAARDLIVRRERSDVRGRLALLERGVVGAEWSHLQEHPAGNRVTLYGFKGGVGRSTATFMLAQHVASSGLCVLVVDLDLESPGVGSLLQDESELPDHGLVDHLVEAGVGNEAELKLVCRSQTVQAAGNGEVWLAPAGGRPRDDYDYLAKLNRVYTDLPAGGRDGQPRVFASRLADAIGACEAEVAHRSRKPDLVLLDSRAGIHDIAAVAMTQLSEVSLLFAADTGPTWAGYRALFQQWMLDPERARTIRERLRMVAALVPSSSRDRYLESFRDHSQACFADTLYDDVLPGSEDRDGEGFNPAPGDDDAPHSPLPILFTSELVGLDHANRRDWSRSAFVQSAYGEFLHGATLLVLGDDGG